LQPQPSPKQLDWLRELAKTVRAENYVLSFGENREEDEPIVYCESDGTWRAGRYVGVVHFPGGRLVIDPRFGINTLTGWLTRVTNLVLVDSPGCLREDISFVVRLVAAVWARGFVEAARHGLPALRQERRNVGPIIRGRLDVQGTLVERIRGRKDAVSIRRERTLDNPVANILAAAYAVLRRWIGPGRESHWLTEQARDLLPRLLSVTGNSPRIPRDPELARVRYTPITQGYAGLVKLSHQIVRHRGVLADASAEGEAKGVLLDVAELWELFVLSIVKEAVGELEVSHGTSEECAFGVLLTSEKDGSHIGYLRPDAVFRSEQRVVGVLDAKYKSLWPSESARQGPQREDLYQLASYLTAEGLDDQAWGVLAYPIEADRPGVPWAEERNPWQLDTHSVWFLTLPHNAEDAVAAIQRKLFSHLQTSPTEGDRRHVLSPSVSGAR
jgi:5-methylcytosine-specific restriction enzyme subunit McrC